MGHVRLVPHNRAKAEIGRFYTVSSQFFPIRFFFQSKRKGKSGGVSFRWNVSRDQRGLSQLSTVVGFPACLSLACLAFLPSFSSALLPSDVLLYFTCCSWHERYHG